VTVLRTDDAADGLRVIRRGRRTVSSAYSTGGRRKTVSEDDDMRAASQDHLTA
jgi:hypothetical protein